MTELPTFINREIEGGSGLGAENWKRKKNLQGSSKSHVCVLSHLVVSVSVTPWTVARQAPLSMEFSRQEYWSGLPFPSPRDLPTQGSKLGLLNCGQILYHLSHQGHPTQSRGCTVRQWSQLGITLAMDTSQ